MSTMKKRASRLVCPHCGKPVERTYQSINIYEHGFRYLCPEPVVGEGFVSVVPITRAQYEARKRVTA